MVRKTVVLFIVLLTMSLFMTGCFSERGANHVVLEKMKTMVEVEKRATATIVKNGVYITGITTLMYTFAEFMELSDSEKEKVYVNTKAYIVYKDKYIDMFTFGNDINVTANSFLSGTNGVKAVLDESIIPMNVKTKSGSDTISRNGILPNLVINESFLNRVDKIFFYFYDFTIKVDNSTVDGIEFIGATIQAGSLKVTKGTTETVFTGKLSVNQDVTVISIVIKQGMNIAKIKQNCSFGIMPLQTSMILVESGTFTMGNTLGGGYNNETPTHQVTLNYNFYISKYEVTQAEFQSVMGFNPSYFTGATSNNPVEQVTWYDCVAYCNAKSATEGLGQYYNISSIAKSGNQITSAVVTINIGAKGYRLPTEAEWEYAAKGGRKASTPYKPYSGSDIVGDVAWYNDNSYPTNANNGDAYGGNLKGTMPVGKKQANELGIYDMSGNVWEWCFDWYGSYSADNQTNPSGSMNSSERGVRGGSWDFFDYFMRSTNRNSLTPNFSDHNLGFRIVRAE